MVFPKNLNLTGRLTERPAIEEQKKLDAYEEAEAEAVVLSVLVFYPRCQATDMNVREEMCVPRAAATAMRDGT